MKKRMTRRVRITLSLSADLVRRIDKERKKGTPRSRAVEAMLEQAQRQKKQQDLDEEIRAYYAQGDPEADAISTWMVKAVRARDLDGPPARRRHR